MVHLWGLGSPIYGMLQAKHCAEMDSSPSEVHSVRLGNGWFCAGGHLFQS